MLPDQVILGVRRGLRNLLPVHVSGKEVVRRDIEPRRFRGIVQGYRAAQKEYLGTGGVVGPYPLRVRLALRGGLRLPWERHAVGGINGGGPATPSVLGKRCAT